MMGSSCSRIYREIIIILLIFGIAQALYWFMVAQPIVEDQRRANFLAEKDPGSFLVPVSCTFFRGTDGKDFVRALHARASDEICWYTRRAFDAYFPGLRLANENETIRRQVERMKTAVFRSERAGSSLSKAVLHSVQIGMACAIPLAYLLYRLWRTRRPEDVSAADDGWNWRMRGR